MNTPAINLSDGYKIDHRRHYPKNTQKVVTNGTPRKSRIPGINKVVQYGPQWAVKRYLVEEFGKWFDLPTDVAVKRYARRINNYLPPGHGITFEHIEELHKLQYLPIRIKAVKEGSLIPIRVPAYTITNTLPQFFWLVNYLETLISCSTWGPSTSATTAYNYKKILRKWAKKTGGDLDFVQWQGHDFSFRGMFGVEAAQMSGSGHLLSFYGTDTVPAIDFLEEYYGADSDKEIVGGSVAATEHAVMCVGTGFYIWDHYKGDWERIGDAELSVFKRLITEIYPNGIISIVSDTWNLWKVIVEYLPALREIILAREGKLVIRPDSSPRTPVEIILGDDLADTYENYSPEYREAAKKGLIRSLYEIFPGETNEKGFKTLHPCVGTIYGDSITMERAELIGKGLHDLGFVSTCIVLGIGSYTYQNVTRDVYGWALKATYAEVLSSDGSTVHKLEIFKDPITDDGTKKSAKGLIKVYYDEEGKMTYRDQVSWEEEEESIMEVIFEDSKIYNFQTLSEIRARLQAELEKEELELESQAA